MRETDSTMLVGKSVVLITWKYPNEAEIRRKVYMDPDDYELLRKLLAGGLTQPDVDLAKSRGTYVSLAAISTPVTTVSDIESISLVQIVGYVTAGA